MIPRRGLLAGLEIITSPHLTVQKNVARSPSRALRRWRKGIRKVSPFADVPAPYALQMPGGQMVMHPAMLARFQREVEEITGINSLPADKPTTTAQDVLRKAGAGNQRMRSILDDWHRAVRLQFGIFGDMTS